eukprot:TRINITY_DN12728_c0_g1_i1.p1 TRINITY_DN12728_c0_g1~~TRINITY_DN12728_c0_g1_i1.p1  ORF type:complete len:313 (-),score=32.37 TRINITY_DN12728_c0_g1_i1:49-897(-)
MGQTCFVNAGLQIFNLIFPLLDPKDYVRSSILNSIRAVFMKTNRPAYEHMILQFRKKFIDIDWDRRGDTNVFLKHLLDEVLSLDSNTAGVNDTIGIFKRHTQLTIGSAAKCCPNCSCEATIPQRVILPIDELSRGQSLADAVVNALYYTVTCIGCGDVLKQNDGSAALVHLPQFLILEIPEAEWELDLTKDVSLGKIQYEWVGFSMASSEHAVSTIRDEKIWHGYDDQLSRRETLDQDFLCDTKRTFRTWYPYILTAICKTKHPVTVEASVLCSAFKKTAPS